MANVCKVVKLSKIVVLLYLYYFSIIPRYYFLDTAMVRREQAQEVGPADMHL